MAWGRPQDSVRSIPKAFRRESRSIAGKASIGGLGSPPRPLLASPPLAQASIHRCHSSLSFMAPLMTGRGSEPTRRRLWGCDAPARMHVAQYQQPNLAIPYIHTKTAWGVSASSTTIATVALWPPHPRTHAGSLSTHEQTMREPSTGPARRRRRYQPTPDPRFSAHCYPREATSDSGGVHVAWIWDAPTRALSTLSLPDRTSQRLPPSPWKKLFWLDGLKDVVGGWPHGRLVLHAGPGHSHISYAVRSNP